MASLFAVLNPRGLDALPIRNFAVSLRKHHFFAIILSCRLASRDVYTDEYCPTISYFEGFCLGCACDLYQRNEITLKDIVYLQVRVPNHGGRTSHSGMM
jgi:hypothetical protein